MCIEVLQFLKEQLATPDFFHPECRIGIDVHPSLLKLTQEALVALDNTKHFLHCFYRRQRIAVIYGTIKRNIIVVPPKRHTFYDFGIITGSPAKNLHKDAALPGARLADAYITRGNKVFMGQIAT